MISVRFQGKPFNTRVNQLYAPTSNAEEAEVEWFYEDLQDLLELIPQKRCPFHYRGLECKSRRSRNTWSNRQIWPWSTKWSRAKTNSLAKRTHGSYQTPSSNNTRDNSTHGHHQMVNTKIRLFIFLQLKMEKLYTVSKNKTGSWLWSNHERFIAKFRLKLKKVGKTTRPFRYDINQILYD